MPGHHDELLDESLARLAPTGPEFGGGLSNHGPMAAEALIRMGRADDVERWVDGYLRRLDAPPRPSDRITDATWRDALGDLRRVADWEAYLARQLAEEPWLDVLARWWPRLVPGLAAAATHGIIRTSHAARSLAAGLPAQPTDSPGRAAEPPERVAELAKGLAYWAAAYLELPGSRRTGGHLDLATAVGRLPRRAAPPGRGLITEQLGIRLADDTELPAAVALLRPPQDVQADLRDLAAMFARQFLVYGRQRPIALLHAITAPTAARSVLPLLPGHVARDTYDALWQVGAVLHATYSSGAIPEPLPEQAPPAPGDLVDRAVATGDEHAIKLTEACLRLHAESGDPVLLHAAARATDLLRLRERAGVTDLDDAAEGHHGVGRAVGCPACLLVEPAGAGVRVEHPEHGPPVAHGGKACHGRLHQEASRPGGPPVRGHVDRVHLADNAGQAGRCQGRPVRRGPHGGSGLGGKAGSFWPEGGVANDGGHPASDNR